MLATTSSSDSTRRTCRVVSRRDEPSGIRTLGRVKMTAESSENGAMSSVYAGLCVSVLYFLLFWRINGRVHNIVSYEPLWIIGHIL